MKYSIKNLLALAIIAGIAAGCAAPAPTPVITQEATTEAEKLRQAEASAAYAQALKALAEKEYDRAEQQLKQMSQSYPEYAGIDANLGIVYMHTERDKEAQASFKTALQKKPDFMEVYIQLGLLHRMHGRFDLAKKTYLHALKTDPTYALTHLNLGILYDLYLMEEKNALRHYKIYKDMAQPPEDDPVHKWIVDLSNRVGAE